MSLELDERMSEVVLVSGVGFTVGTKVQVITNGTLVSDASDVALTRFVLA